ncbi:hypothetical protein [Nocardiopsis sp. FIRDI 009]|uniref:hypothetical protein n=1 Tax=Nocardiopsis sp. FIRDI 009 TaxID=714197 RepID=UPI000E27CA48|nr:hypothetical protein [Nocardiopsis sp. FIRDI 009]
MTDERTRLSYLDTHVDVTVAPGADIGGAHDFLGTHVTVGPAEGPEPLADLRVAAEPEEWPSAPEWREGFVRQSASDFFTIPARLARVDGRDLVECVRTGTRFAIDHATRRIDAVADPKGALDLVELLRDLFLKDQENRGAVVLHATAAVRDGEAVLVTGAKGTGKSTILLELVEHCGFRILSGDKTVLREQPDGAVLASGWPGYPHLGHGTIAKYPGLPEITDVSPEEAPAADFSPYGKYAVDPVRFRERFPSTPVGLSFPVRGVLHPRIGPGTTRVTPLTGGTEGHVSALAANVESAFGAPVWHRLTDDRRATHRERRGRVLRTLGPCPAWSLTGPGDLTPEALPAELL